MYKVQVWHNAAMPSLDIPSSKNPRLEGGSRWLIQNHIDATGANIEDMHRISHM